MLYTVYYYFDNTNMLGQVGQAIYKSMDWWIHILVCDTPMGTLRLGQANV
jgi:hypothetical protein